jgi:hypothetical protein
MRKGKFINSLLQYLIDTVDRVTNWHAYIYVGLTYMNPSFLLMTDKYQTELSS